MNILVISAWCPYPADNGSRLRAYNLLKQLAGQGHRLTLIGFGQDDSDLALAETGLAPLSAGGVRLFPSRFFRPGTMKAWLGFFSRKPRMLLDTWRPEAAEEIARQCRRDEYDVVLALQLGIAHYIPADLPHPCVLDEVEVSSFVRPLGEARSWRKRLRLGLMVAKFRAHVASLGPRFVRWTAVSDDERQAIRRLVGPRAALPPIEILPNGVDLRHNTYESDAEYEPDTLVYNGALSFYANREAVDHFLGDILPIIHRERPQAQLRVTGRTDAVSSDDPLRRQPGLTLTGYLDDVRPAVRGAAVCVVPLRQGGGTRLKILEAMALGTPVVATPRGAEGLDARDGEEILIADAPEEFAAATLRLMTDTALRRRLSAAGRAFVERKFGWDAIAADLGRTLASVADAGVSMQEHACL
jgi:glycosyltransferase involved in cell wall biosynthesis